MNVFALICLLPYALFVLQQVTAAAVIGRETDSDVIDIKTDSKENSFANGKDESVDVSEKITDVETPPPSTTSAIYTFIAKGIDLNNRYGYLLPKISSIILSGGLSLNLFSVMSVLPYVILALQKTNAPSSTAGPAGNRTSGPYDLLLTSALENPENLKKFFSDKSQGEVVIGAMKHLAGPDASRLVDRLIENVKRNSTDAEGGKAGIDGEHLFRFLQRSDSLKSLLPTEQLANEGMNLIDNFMNTMLNPEFRDIKDKLFDGANDVKGENDTVEDAVRRTVSNSARVVLDVGHAKMNGMLHDLNSEVVGNVADWKSTSGNMNNGSFAGGLQNMIINKTPDRVLTLFATANVLTNRYSHLIPTLATYFLPVGVGMDALKFVCLVTYVLLIAKQQNIIPEIEKGKIETLSGINTDKIFNTLNNKEIIDRISPLKDYSNLGISTIKLLASPEAMAVDNFVGELINMKNEKGGDQLLDKSTLFDLFRNSEFVRKLYAVRGFTDEKMKDYLGLDIGRLKNEITDEMNKNNTNGNQEPGNGRLDPSAIAKTVADALLATYRVCSRKTNEQIVSRMKTVNEGIQKVTAKMARASGPPDGESAGAAMLRNAVYVPKSLAQLGLLGTTAAANRLASYFGTANGSSDDKVIVETPPSD